MRAAPAKGAVPGRAAPRRSKVTYTLFALGTDGSMRKLTGLTADELCEVARFRNTQRMRAFRAKERKASK